MKQIIKRSARKSQFYIAPSNGSESNNIIMRELARRCGATDDNIIMLKICGSSRDIEVIQVLHSDLKRFVTHAKEFNLKFNTYKKNIDEGCATKWKFTEFKSIKKSTQIKKTEHWVARQRQKSA